MTKVLHAVDVYLRVSENWIYPQIHRVEGVTPAVLCERIENADQFPLRGAPVHLDPPPWHEGYGVPRIVNQLASRAGYPSLVAGRAVRRWEPGLLHAHFGMRGWGLLKLKKRLGVPMATSFYGFDAWALPQQHPAWRERFRELFKRGEAFIVEGPAMGERLQFLGCPAEKIHIVRIGVDLKELPLPDHQPGATPRVLMMARFTEKKGLTDGLRACVEAARQGAHFEVTIVGDSSPADAAGLQIKAELLEIAGASALKGRVAFTGFVPAAKSRMLMREHDIYLCPSKHANGGDAEGGSPVSLTEAMALEKLCIGTRHCDIPEVIRHCETGLLAESGDVEGLAALLVDALRRPGEMRSLCVRGREHIETYFSTAAQVTALANIYKALAGSAGREAASAVPASQIT